MGLIKKREKDEARNIVWQKLRKKKMKIKLNTDGNAMKKKKNVQSQKNCYFTEIFWYIKNFFFFNLIHKYWSNMSLLKIWILLSQS